MRRYHIVAADLEKFRAKLIREELKPGTIEKYLRDTMAYAAWLGERSASRETASQWKAYLIEGGYAPATINSMVAALNAFFRAMGWEKFRVKALRIQRCIFRSESRELTREEYRRLLETAGRRGRRRLELLMETICATGIRVSEVEYLTVEAAKTGRVDISLKGKVRTILIPARLCQKLIQYAKKEKIASGTVFRTRSGKALSRKQIWAEMKSLCAAAGVEESKVFPHNLRHLFARSFYEVNRDVVKLADVLGHSSIETTRIYLISTGIEHAREIERLGLIS